VCRPLFKPRTTWLILRRVFQDLFRSALHPNQRPWNSSTCFQLLHHQPRCCLWCSCPGCYNTSVLFLNVARLSLGIETAGLIMTVLILLNRHSHQKIESSPLSLTIKPMCLFKYTKEIVLTPRSTDCSASSNSLVFLPPLSQVEVTFGNDTNGVLNVSCFGQDNRKFQSHHHH
jgi:molecular chaperone DnaK (HSP70)